MKNLIMTVALAVAGAAFAEDGYLYWMVDVSDAGDTYAFETVTLKGKGSDDFVPFAGPDSSVLGTVAAVDDGETTKASDLWSYFASGLVYDTYLIELWQNGDTRVGYSEISKGTLKDMLSKPGEPASGYFTVNGAQMVPEPTGGLLLLLGVAALGLRRKRPGQGFSADR